MIAANGRLTWIVSLAAVAIAMFALMAKESGGCAQAAAGTCPAADSPTLLPTANDSGALGASGTALSDAFFASGATINFNAGNMTITHSAGRLAVGGGDLNAPASLTSGDPSPAATTRA